MRGTAEEFYFYDRDLSAEEVLDLYEEDTFQEVDDSKFLLSLPLRSNYNDGSDQVTENIGSLGGTVQLGDGTTSTTFPTQLTPKGMSFDGTTDYLNAGDIANGLSVFTWSSFVEFNAFSDFRGVFIKTSGAAASRISLNMSGATYGGNRELFVAIGNGAPAYGYTTDVGLVAGKKYHIVVVFDGSGSGNANRLMMYVNGVKKTLSFSGTMPATTYTGAHDFVIGDDYAAAGRELNGSIYSPRFSSTIALTTTQAKWLYEKDRRLLNI